MKKIIISNLEGFYLMDSSDPAGDDSSSHFYHLHSDIYGGNNYTCIIPEPQTPYTHIFLPLLHLLPDFHSKHLPPDAPESQGPREENSPCFCVTHLDMTLELSSTEPVSLADTVIALKLFPNMGSSHTQRSPGSRLQWLRPVVVAFTLILQLPLCSLPRVGDFVRSLTKILLWTQLSWKMNSPWW